MEIDARALIERCVAGDEAAWEAFVNYFDTSLRRGIGSALSRRRPMPTMLMDDLLQEVYCRLIESGGRRLARCRERGEPAIRAYLARLAHNVAVDSLRSQQALRRGRRHLVRLPPQGTLLEAAPDRRRSIEEKLILRQQGRRFIRRCRQASTGQRENRDARILALAFLGGWTSSEISLRLGQDLSPGSIDSVISRARRRLAANGVRLVSRRGPASRRRRRRRRALRRG